MSGRHQVNSCTVIIKKLTFFKKVSFFVFEGSGCMLPPWNPLFKWGGVYPNRMGAHVFPERILTLPNEILLPFPLASFPIDRLPHAPQR